MAGFGEAPPSAPRPNPTKPSSGNDANFSNCNFSSARKLTTDADRPQSSLCAPGLFGAAAGMREKAGRGNPADSHPKTRRAENGFVSDGETEPPPMSFGHASPGNSVAPTGSAEAQLLQMKESDGARVAMNDNCGKKDAVVRPEMEGDERMKKEDPRAEKTGDRGATWMEKAKSEDFRSAGGTELHNPSANHRQDAAAMGEGVGGHSAKSSNAAFATAEGRYPEGKGGKIEEGEETSKIEPAEGNGRPFSRTRSSSFDATKEDRGSRITGDDNASERGERASLGPETAPGPFRGRGRDDFGISVLAEAGAEIGATGRLSGVGAGTFGGKEPSGTTSTTTSFLDALSEEERRVRTRHLPSVEGFRVLYRSEVKQDLALAKAMLNGKGSTGSVSSSSGKGGRARRGGGGGGDSGNEKEGSGSRKHEDDRMDIDEEEGTGVSDYETTSDVSGGGKVSSKSIRVDSAGLGLGPSDAFVPPTDDFVTTLTGGGTAASCDSAEQKPVAAAIQPTLSMGGQHQGPRYPHVIESITAFNPPRPPESIGPKKKHRLLRWERNPQDVEVDLHSYRKTVQRTREELHNAERERERIEITGAHLRSHFLNHLKSLREESVLLNQELRSIQMKCIETAELQTSKTRSRGAGKGGYIMRDVLSVLKARGSKLNGDAMMAQGAVHDDGTWCIPGIGGVSSTSEDRDDRALSLAKGWLLPGDKVATPYGEGIVLYVFGPRMLDVDEAVPEGIIVKRNKPKQFLRMKLFPSVAQRHGFGGVNAASISPSSQPVRPLQQPQGMKYQAPHSVQSGVPSVVAKAGSPPFSTGTFKPMPKEQQRSVPALTKQPRVKIQYSSAANTCESTKRKQQRPGVLSARVCVRMCFGVGFFSPESLKCLENPSTYSDEKLMSRWKKMMDTANIVGGYVDVVGMDSAVGDCVSRSSSSIIPGNDLESTTPSKDASKADLAPEESPVPAAKDNEKSNEGSGIDAGRTHGQNAFTGQRSSAEVGGNRSKVTGDSLALGEKSEEGKIREHQQPLICPANVNEKMDTGGLVAEGGSAVARAKNRVLPVGANMLRSPGLSGFLLSEVPLDTLEKNIDPVLFDRGGVLGRDGYPGVPSDFKEWEDQRYEVCSLRGKVLQLRNELYRQRRIRILNERSRISGQERAERVEGLLAEMKSDLTSLKERLQDELIELGVDQEKAEELLGIYMREQESASMDDVLSPKMRHRKAAEEEQMAGQYENEPLPTNGVDNSSSMAVNAGVADHSLNLYDEGVLRRTNNKRGRSEIDSSSGAEGNKPKRSGYRRQ